MGNGGDAADDDRRDPGADQQRFRRTAVEDQPCGAHGPVIHVTCEHEGEQKVGDAGNRPHHHQRPGFEYGVI